MSIETLRFGSKPVELYKFTRGLTVWRQTSAAEVFSIPDGNYIPTMLKRNAPEISEDASHTTLTIDVEPTHPIATLFYAGPPGSSIWLNITRYMVGGTTPEAYWYGKVRGVKVSSSGPAQLLCEPMDKILNRCTLRRTYGYACGLRLYSPACGASESANTIGATVHSVTNGGVTVELEETPSGSFKLGELYCESIDARREVIAHVGKVLTLSTPLPNLPIGPVKLLRGCDHLWPGDCVNTFHNGANYGGWPFVPVGDRNPFVHTFM